MNAESNEELEWIAFCYLTGDLPPDEAAAFEQRLADDQAVREAVCRMAALRDKLVTTSGRTDEPVSLREVTSASRLGRQTSRLRRVAAAAVWAACGAAAASLCFFLPRFGRTRFSREGFAIRSGAGFAALPLVRPGPSPRYFPRR